MNKAFWLESGRLAGRAGPNTEPWDLAGLRAGGIGAIISVNGGQGVAACDLHALGLSYACCPMPDRVPPIPADEVVCLAAVEQAYEFIMSHLSEGRAVLVHCTAGKDRTGLVLAHYLVRSRGLSPTEAIAAVRQVRPIALNALGWEELALAVLSRTTDAAEHGAAPDGPRSGAQPG